MTLECFNLRRCFADGRLGLDDLSLSLGRPEFTVISGRNGSGKSMLLRHLLGLERADSGRVELDGQPIDGRLAELRRRVGLVFQEPEHQILGVTVADDLAFGPRSRGLKPAAYAPGIREALAACGLEGYEHHLTSSLSGGEKRRLAVASCLLSEPELLLLDEPFNDLDWRGAADLLRVLIGLGSRGVAVVVVTHDLEKCLAHAGRLVVLSDGRVERDDQPARLWDELPGLGLRRLPGGPERLSEMSWV